MAFHKNENAGFIFDNDNKRAELLFFLNNYPLIDIKFLLEGLDKKFKFKDLDKFRLSDHLSFIKKSLWFIYDFISELIFILKYNTVGLSKFLNNFSNFVGESKFLNYLLYFSRDNFEDENSLQFWVSRLIDQVRMIFNLLDSNLNFNFHEKLNYEIKFNL